MDDISFPSSPHLVPWKDASNRRYLERASHLLGDAHETVGEDAESERVEIGCGVAGCSFARTPHRNANVPLTKNQSVG